MEKLIYNYNKIKTYTFKTAQIIGQERPCFHQGNWGIERTNADSIHHLKKCGSDDKSTNVSDINNSAEAGNEKSQS